LWKFIEPNSPPITQKLLPVVMISLLLYFFSALYSAA
jgi:hypothetical protein